MDYFWIIIRCIEDLAVGSLLFALLTACVVRLRRKMLAFTVLAIFILCVVGASVLAIALGYKLFTAGPHFTILRNMLIVSVVIHLVGYFTIARFGWRRRDPDALPAAATWPRSRLLLAFFVALVLNVVTHWNITLAVQQRLAREEVEAGVMMLSVMPGRPIDSHNAAILYEPVFERLPNNQEQFIPDDWLDYDKPLDTNDPKLRELLANHRRDLDTLVRASARSHCYFDKAFLLQGIDVLGSARTHHVWKMSLAARLLAVDTRLKLARGNLESAANNTTALFRIARHAVQDPALMSALVSLEIDRQGAASLLALLNHPDLSTNILNRLQLEAAPDYRRTLNRTWTIEESAAIILVKRASVEGFDFVTEEEGNALGTFLWKSTNPYFIEYELEILRSTYQEQRVAFDQPWPEISKRNTNFHKMKYRGVCTAVLMPALPNVITLVMIGDARHRLYRLAIAMRRYELEHGELPESFDDLTPTYIEEAPLDPSIEEPFKVEDVEGGVRLYSAGIEAWDRNEYPGDRIKDAGGMVEMFLK